ncbi:MAG: YbfB/YjiJ family MFS transporter [Alphaproteobacteria bacterium]|nr:MAG: YbfB/YjiJ family MFS transporter [Alphaproteobacteria bacterium]
MTTGRVWSYAWVLAAAIAAMTIAQGVGRFILTPLLPAMQQAGGLDAAAAGLVGSANFAGYLAGALVATALPVRARSLVLGGGVLVVIGTLLTAADPAWWLIGRAIAGFGGAFVFVACGSAGPAMLERAGRPERVLHIYTGVGVAIAGTGLLALIAGPAADRVWLLAGVLALVLLPLAALLDAPAPKLGTTMAGSVAVGPLLRVLVAYGAVSFGFGAGGTFFVRVFSGGDALVATLAWIAAGVIMAPSVLIWARIATRHGPSRAVVMTGVIHALGLGIAVISTAPIPATVAGVLLGASFMGVTALCLGRVRAYAPGHGQRAIAVATVVFGIGQVVGPLVAGPLLDATGTPAAAFGLAAFITLAGALTVLPDARREGAR